MQAQFSGVQGAYLYSDGPGDAPTEHAYIDDYVCHAFPDDAYVTDQFFVGLISVAVALPIDLFLARAFEIANEGELPGNWLDAMPGKWKLLLGKDAHHGWRLADPRRPVSEFVRWMVGGGAESDLQAVLFVVGYVLRRLRARLFGEPPAPCPEDAAGGKGAHQGDGNEEPAAAASATRSGSAASSAGAKARTDALKKRLYSAAGLLGVYATWTIMAWFIFTCAHHACARGSAHMRLTRFPFRGAADGMLIYRQLGAAAQQEFAKTWGVGYALNNASEWQEVLTTACKAALLVVVLDALRLTKNSNWFEQHGACGGVRGGRVVCMRRAVFQRGASGQLPPRLLTRAACALPSQWTLSACKQCSSTAPRAPGGRRRTHSSGCKRG